MATLTKEIYINLPVDDLSRSRSFFESLGFGFNPDYSDETAACLILGENIFCMLSSAEKFSTFITREARKTDGPAETILSITLSSREAVDTLVDQAMSLGAGTQLPPVDYGWMYYRSFTDLDGHAWEAMTFDPDQMKPS